MKYRIEKNNDAPYYLQLYQQLRDDIINKVYILDNKLPSKRNIAVELGISVVTVEHAYSLLCDEGYIEARERSGYYVIFRSDDFFINRSRDRLINYKNVKLENPEKTFSFPLLAKTFRYVLNEYGEDLLIRSHNSGCDILRDAIRGYLARSRGIYIDSDQIIIGSGSEYLYTLIIELIGRNHIFAIESPSYQQIEETYRAADVKIEKLPLCNDGIDSRAMWNSNAHILHITPYSSYPSGVSASASKRYEYLNWALAKNGYIIEDDFESEFSVSKKVEDTLFSQTKNDDVIYMNTFSKTISPSLRVAYMALPKKLAYVFREKLGFLSCTVPTIVQFVLAVLINKGDFERQINRIRRQKRKELQNK